MTIDNVNANTNMQSVTDNKTHSQGKVREIILVFILLNVKSIHYSHYNNYIATDICIKHQIRL